MEPVCHFMYMNPSMLRVLLHKKEWVYFINRQAGSQFFYTCPFPEWSGQVVTILVMLGFIITDDFFTVYNHFRMPCERTWQLPDH